MRNHKLIVRQLQSKYPEVYSEIMTTLLRETSSELSPILSSFCHILKCTIEDVSTNKDGLRTLFVACIIKCIDPECISSNTRLRKNVLTQVSDLLDVPHDNIKQVSCNVKGLLRAHKPFIREVDRIINAIAEENESKDRQ